ncbi:hypothetical protein C8J56DRAFT_1019521 [Mycena floridula]|nr:hypothetical protein C8J56DRAFT_1019521 [Mycena floridula]
MPLDVPLEIISLIVQPFRYDEKALKSFSMLSHLWSSACRPLLFSRLVLEFAEPRHHTRTRSFIALLDTSPDIAGLVKDVEIRGPYFMVSRMELSRRDVESNVESDMRAICEVLQRLKKVNTVTCDLVRFAVNIPDYFIDCLSTFLSNLDMNLSRVKFTQCGVLQEAMLMRILEGCRGRLKELEIEGSGTDLWIYEQGPREGDLIDLRPTILNLGLKVGRFRISHSMLRPDFLQQVIFNPQSLTNLECGPIFAQAFLHFGKTMGLRLRVLKVVYPDVFDRLAGLPLKLDLAQAPQLDSFQFVLSSQSLGESMIYPFIYQSIASLSPNIESVSVYVGNRFPQHSPSEVDIAHILALDGLLGDSARFPKLRDVEFVIPKAEGQTDNEEKSAFPILKDRGIKLQEDWCLVIGYFCGS